MIRFACPSCGFSLSAPEDCAGRSSKCRGCGQAFQVPAPVATLITAPNSPPIRCRCPRCQQSLEAPAEQGGQKTRCPKCGQRIQVPQTPLPPLPLNKTMLGDRETGSGMDFSYNCLPINSRPSVIRFSVATRGELTKLTRVDRMHISGGGGGSYASASSGHAYASTSPIHISTSHTTRLDLWLTDDHGREKSVRLHADIPLKEGHRLSLIEASGIIFVVVNHTARDAHIVDDSGRLIQLNNTEVAWLSLGGGLLSLLSLVLMAASPKASALFLIWVPLFCGLVGMWKDAQRRLLREDMGMVVEHVLRGA